jgi:hypothetical protein
MRPIQRLRFISRVRALAWHIGYHDELGELGTVGVGWLRQRRREALAAGCVPDDVDDATIDGLERGRQHVHICRLLLLQPAKGLRLFEPAKAGAFAGGFFFGMSASATAAGAPS